MLAWALLMRNMEKVYGFEKCLVGSTNQCIDELNMGKALGERLKNGTPFVQHFG